MRFKHLKLFGACSVATLLFCFDVDGMNWQQALKTLGTEQNNQRLVNVANTPVDLLERGIVLEDVRPNNNAQNKSNSERAKPSVSPKKENSKRSFVEENSEPNKAKGVNAQNWSKSEKQNPSVNPKKENPKRSTVKKLGSPSQVGRGEFVNWMSGMGFDARYFYYGGAWFRSSPDNPSVLQPEDKEMQMLLNVSDYIYELVEQGMAVEKNGVRYFNQCPILALNLDENQMSMVYDEMDKYEEYGNNFAKYMNDNSGLAYDDYITWNRISDLIKHRIGIYTTSTNGGSLGVFYGKDDLPVKRTYLQPRHYQELLISKKPSAETSEQRNREEQSRETETPKQEKKKTVEDVRKEFIDAINAKKKPGETKIDILKNIFENSGLTDNDELKKEMNLFESIFGESLNKFNSVFNNKVLLLKEEVSQTLKREFCNDDDFKKLKNVSEFLSKKDLVSDLSKKVAEIEINLSKMKSDIYNSWFEKVEGSSVNKDVKKVLHHVLDNRLRWFNGKQGEISEYRAVLRLIDQRILESSIIYNNPTFEQAKKFTKAECEKAIKDGVIKVDNISVLEWGPYSTVMKKVKELNGNLSRAENQAGAALAWKFLVRDNRTLFNDPEFVRGIKDSLIRFCDIQLSNRNIDKVCADRFNAMKEVISKL